MKTEIFVHSAFSYLEDFIRHIPENFSHLGDEIYNGRNDVRLTTVYGKVLTIKYFKRITLANRYIFATIRKSKARRAYEHSELIIQRGITSPQPVAYINCYQYGMLYHSYYISLHTHYLPLMDILQQPLSASEQALKAFARFIYRVHQAGIFHKDLTIRNVLYFNEDDHYDFSLIDTNRMSFHPYTFKRGMNNLDRLALPVASIGIVTAEYARMAHVSETRVLNAFVFSRWKANMRGILKKWLKKPLYLFIPRYRKSSYIVTKETSLAPKKVVGYKY